MELTPVEILMLDYIGNGIPVDYKNYPGYWNYQYNVDPQKLLKRLRSKGLVVETSDIVQNLNNSTIDMLKPVLKKYNLKVSGRKKELIDRIIKNIPKYELETLFNTEYYKLTEQAIAILEANDHIPYAHRHQNFGVSIYQAHEMKLKRPELSPQEIAWQFLNAESSKRKRAQDWGLYRNARGNMATLLIEEKQFKEALPFLFEVCYIDLSGLSNGFDPELLFIYEKHYFPYEESLAKVNDHYIDQILKIKHNLNLSNEELEGIYIRTVSNLALPFQLFTDDEVFEIITSEFVSDTHRVIDIYKNAEARYFSKTKKRKLKTLLRTLVDRVFRDK